MDAQTKLIFEQADAALFPATGTSEGVVTLAKGSRELADVCGAIMKGRECASRLEDAIAVLRYYALAEIYASAVPATPIAEDGGSAARAFLARMAD